MELEEESLKEMKIRSQADKKGVRALSRAKPFSSLDLNLNPDEPRMSANSA